MLPIWLYQKLVGPWKPDTCRFEPTCSVYAMQALRDHGALRGSWLTVTRLCRCHPFCEPGHDPVPPPRTTPTASRCPSDRSQPR